MFNEFNYVYNFEEKLADSDKMAILQENSFFATGTLIFQTKPLRGYWMIPSER